MGSRRTGGQDKGRARGSRGPGAGRRSARDHTIVVWLLGALVVAAAHRVVPEATWLMVHLVLLGALTHSVFVWSQHFAAALLKTRPDETATRQQGRRLSLLGIGSLAVFIGVPATWWWLVVTGAGLVCVAVVWHGWSLWRQLRVALPGRFRISVWYYVLAAAFLPVGAGLGAALALGLDSTWHWRVLVAHTMANLLGWIGLTVVGTLVTFWPTVLRTRMDDRAESLARAALPWFVGAIAVVITGALTGVRAVAVAGLVGHLAVLLFWGRSLIRPLRTRPPREFAAASILAAMAWGVIALTVTGWVVLFTPVSGWSASATLLAAVWAGGFAVQLLTGALSYLLPSVLGGGPRVVRAGAAWFDRWATFRLVVINGGLLLFLAPVTQWVKILAAGCGLLGAAMFLPLMFRGIRASITERRAVAAEAAGGPGATTGRNTERPSAITMNGLLAGVVALTVAISLGVGLEPAGDGSRATRTVSPTGNTVRVQVKAEGMRFVPDSVAVTAGDRVIIELVNTDPTMIHDLTLAGRTTPRLAVGETAELDLGVVAESSQGWCTVVGHRQAGMVLALEVAGSTPTGQEQPAPTGHNHAPAQADSARLQNVVDPVAPPLSDEKVHHIEMRVTEVPLEVAPGVWQRRWTFNGNAVGPTLRGRVGDVFEVTLVNDGTMGHSIDFHASNLAPDEPMRTIAPGESLVYRFTAMRAGIWMYHCGTPPVSSHIAAGMHGAVIIEPEEGFPAVDREYVVVASEIYLADGTGDSPGTAADVDSAQAQTEIPDHSTFNGIAYQYVQQPFRAKVGERVRFWVLAAGPNLSTSFHVVGAQFDTVHLEGAYLLKDRTDPFGNTSGGSQALGLEAAQGGFVEMTFPEAGHYTAVDHAFLDAERGAIGIVEVTP
ncbi:copper oxidase [Arachnia propionica]|uniref:Copper-containing nitrite reductase n=1 Tax=Arachnia propionica TaxID=1750 RepID=A0A3P1TA36_9ACTN|nr:multicopper oxidase domain-containing protein [Arachnia propionica]RRD06249.1 copper oxidase [Arachnia propionica]